MEELELDQVFPYQDTIPRQMDSYQQRRRAPSSLLPRHTMVVPALGTRRPPRPPLRTCHLPLSSPRRLRRFISRRRTILQPGARQLLDLYFPAVDPSRQYIRGASHPGLLPSQEDVLAQPWLSTTGQTAFYAQIAAQKNDDIETLRRAFRKLDVPLRILWARNDTWVPVERASMLSEVLGGSLEIIEDAGHLVQFDAPERLTADLVMWLNSVK